MREKTLLISHLASGQKHDVNLVTTDPYMSHSLSREMRWDMSSRLFRQETGRRLRAVAEQAASAYVERRSLWLDAYRQPAPEAARAAAEMLATSVARGEVAWYRESVMSM